MIKDEGAKQFEETAALVGLSTADGDKLPVVRGGARDLSVTARLLGQVAARLDLFMADRNMVYFDHEGQRSLMDSTTFRTWISDFVVVAVKFDGEDGKPVAGTLSKDEAATVLASPHFRRGVRPLKGVHHVRLPVVRASGELDQLPWGYDDETGIYTIPEGLEYATDMSLEVAKGEFERVFSTFPFSDDRSKAVQVAAMLALFVRCLPGGSSLRPGFLWIANKPESGKSVLGKACQYPVLGKAPVAKMKKHEDLDKEMEAFMRAGVSSIFIDNIYKSFQSQTIDQLLTAEDSTGRAMGGHGVFEAKNRSQFFLTGNGLSLNEDAERRFLVVDLFEAGDPRDRGIPDDGVLSDERMRSEPWRGRMLSMLWAFVRNWHEVGMTPGSHRMGSFEKFSQMIGGIVEAAGYEPPCQRAIIPDAINPERAEFLDLLGAAVEAMGLLTTRDFSIHELCALARTRGLFETHIGTLEEGRKLTIKEDGISAEYRASAEDRGLMTLGMTQSFGKRLKQEVGQTPMVGSRRIEFGKRAQARKSTWTVTVLP